MLGPRRNCRLESLSIRVEGLAMTGQGRATALTARRRPKRKSTLIGRKRSRDAIAARVSPILGDRYPAFHFATVAFRFWPVVAGDGPIPGIDPLWPITTDSFRSMKLNCVGPKALHFR
jgi:hypothetical protein